MLSYFPQFYPDELLYSALARYHRHVASASPKRTAEELFGRPTVIAAADLQGGLGALCERIPPLRGLTPEVLAREYTLYPYYTAFEPASLAEDVLRSLVHGTSEGVHLRLGIAASTVSPPAHLRYCLVCRAEMLKSCGELYWRRDHQLAGVLVCPEHGSPLADSIVRLDMANRHEFLAAHEANCSAAACVPSWASDPRAVELLRQIAISSAALLIAPRLSGNLAEEYRRAASERGFGKGGRIAQGRLAKAYAATMGPVTSLLLGADPNCGSDWLAAMTRKHRKAFHPLRHILFRLFLEKQELQRRPSPFGKGPWPCLNPLAGHYGRRVINQTQVHHDRGRAIGRFACACGYVYALAEGEGSKPRILKLGALFEELLRRQAADGAGLRATARALGVDVDPHTVRLHAARLGLDVPWKAPKPRKANSACDQDAIRGRWLAAQVQQPNLPRKRLASLLAAEHAWLYRNDREWLDVNSPPRRGSSPSNKRPDWLAIDGSLAADLREAAYWLKGEKPPQRVTLAALERRLGRPGWIGKRKGKLQRTVAALKQAVETLDGFRLRRVSWAVSELERLGLPTQAWRARRLAGLPVKVSNSVEAALLAIENGAVGREAYTECS
jgi:hypothetical protein